MITKDECKEIFKETAKKYFIEHIEGKSINQILYNVSYETIINLGKFLGSTRIKTYCLSLILEDKEYIKNVDKNDKLELKDTIKAINIICDDIEKILENITEGLK